MAAPGSRRARSRSSTFEQGIASETAPATDASGKVVADAVKIVRTVTGTDDEKNFPCSYDLDGNLAQGKPRMNGSVAAGGGDPCSFSCHYRHTSADPDPDPDAGRRQARPGVWR
ncbi:hypothetical protein [Streptomyces sp. NPDC004266]|uniref:hypothetical protein n=1 Tax=Streptomyces sp. NPDC004266 TaxID=3364693 RepID=UPI003688055B